MQLNAKKYLDNRLNYRYIHHFYFWNISHEDLVSYEIRERHLLP